jgi:hypothetical protein
VNTLHKGDGTIIIIIIIIIMCMENWEFIQQKSGFANSNRDAVFPF